MEAREIDLAKQALCDDIEAHLEYKRAKIYQE